MDLVNLCQLSFRQISYVITSMNAGYLPNRPLLWNRIKYPWFYIFPLEFGGASDIHKHQNSTILC